MLRFEPVDTPQDLQRTAALAREIWTEHFTPLLGQQQVDYMLQKFQSVPAIRAQIEDGYQYYLLLAENELVGYIGMQPQADALFFSKLYLRKEARGKGYARMAINFLTDYATKHELPRIYLTCNKYNHNTMAAYKAMGFSIIDSTVTDIGGGYVMDDYIWERTL